MADVEILEACREESKGSIQEILSMMTKMDRNAQSLDSKALRSSAMVAVDYLSLFSSRMAEEQASGYLTRLETLSEIQRSLTALQINTPLIDSNVIKVNRVN